jgi:hypothetical protein
MNLKSLVREKAWLRVEISRPNARASVVSKAALVSSASRSTSVRPREGHRSRPAVRWWVPFMPSVDLFELLC